MLVFRVVEGKVVVLGVEEDVQSEGIVDGLLQGEIDVGREVRFGG